MAFGRSLVDDCVWIACETLKRTIYFVCVYRSTACSDAQNNLLLTELNKLPINDDSELVIVGEFNLPDVNWLSGNLKAFSDTNDRNLLNQLNLKGGDRRVRIFSAHNNWWAILEVSLPLPYQRSAKVFLNLLRQGVKTMYYFKNMYSKSLKCAK